MEDVMKLFELFGESPDFGRIDESVALFKEEVMKKKEKKRMEEMKTIVSSRWMSFSKRLPQFVHLFEKEYDINRIVKGAVECEPYSGKLLPTILPVMGSCHKNYPIRGLLKAGGIISPKDLLVEENQWFPATCHPDEPYVTIGVNATIAEDISPNEIQTLLLHDGGSSPFNLDKVAALFLQDDIDLGSNPYSIVALGSLWDKQPLAIKVDQEGKKALVVVPQAKKIPGRVIIPTYAGEVDFLFY